MAEHLSGEVDVVEHSTDAVFTYTQFGVRMPDGTEIWAPLNLSVNGQVVDVDSTQTTGQGKPFAGVDLRRLEEERVRNTPGPYSEAFQSALWTMAGSVYMDPDDYAKLVSVIQREVTLSVGRGRLSVPVTEHMRALS